jgi:multidrug efflux pump subunit AcrA (membrane-fusion protein)
VETNKLSADASMWSSQQSLLNAQNDVNYKNSNATNPSTKIDYTDLEKQSVDSALTQAQKAFSAAEQKYKDSDLAINAAKAQLTSSWLAYQEASSTITAPISGVISGLTLTQGSVVANSTSTSTSDSSSTNSTSQKVGTIKVESGSNQAIVNLTEIDVTKVEEGQKVTLTLDAFSEKTFTGKVLAIDTSGSVSSGVTSYPTIIGFDTAPENLYSNMSVSATIITNIKNNVILVTSSAVQTVNGRSTVRVLKDGKVTSVSVEIGDSNDTQIEIVSGIKEGDTVITGSTSSTTTDNQTSTSPFGAGFGPGR